MGDYGQPEEAKDPLKFPKRYFYNPDKIFKTLPEVYDNSDKNRGF